MPVSNRRKKKYREKLSTLLGDAETNLQNIQSSIGSNDFGSRSPAEQKSTGELINQAETGLQDIQSSLDTQGAANTGQQQTQQNQTTQQNTQNDASTFDSGVSGQDIASSGASYSQFQDIAEGATDMTVEERKQIRRDLGVDEAEADAFYIPEKETQEVFDEAFEKSELGEIKARMNKVQKEIDSTRTDLADSVDQLNDNPFLSEDTRVGRGEKRMGQAERRISNKQSRFQQLQTQYERGLGEIRNMLSRRDSDIARRNQIGKRKLNYLTELANNRAQRIEQDRFADVAEEESVPFITEQQDRQTPDTIGSSDTGYYRWNPDTKQYEMVTAPSSDGGSADGTTLGGDSGTGTGTTAQDGAADNTTDTYTLEDGTTIPGTFEEWVDKIVAGPNSNIFESNIEQSNLPTVAKNIVKEEEERLSQNLGPEARQKLLKQSTKLKDEYNRKVEDAQPDQSRSSKDQSSKPPLTEEQLSPQEERELSRYGIRDAPAPLQTFFLTTPNDFQEEIGRDFADGKYSPSDFTLEELQKAWQKFQEGQDEASSGDSEQEYTKEDVL